MSGLSQANVNAQALGTSEQGTVAGVPSASSGDPLGSAGSFLRGVGDWCQVLQFPSSGGGGKPTPFTIRKTSDGNRTKYLIYLPAGSFTVDGVFLPQKWSGAGIVGGLDSESSPDWYVLNASSASSVYLTMTLPDSSGNRTVRILDSEPDDEDVSYSLLIASIDSDGVDQKTCGPIHLLSVAADTKALSFYSRNRLDDNNAKYADQVPEQYGDSQMFLSLSGFFHDWWHPDWFGEDSGFPRYCSMFHDDVPNAHFVVRFVSNNGDIELGYLPLSVVFLYFIHSLSDHFDQIRNGTEPDMNSGCNIMHLASVITEAVVEYMIRRCPGLEKLCEEDGDEDEDPDDPDGQTLTLKSGDDSNIMFTVGNTTSNEVSIPLDKSSEVKIHAYYV